MKKSERSAPTKKTKYSPSKTVQGQALVPAELLKRHLAGTLPDIQKTPEFTYDEEGRQVSEDLSGLELHELHDLAQQLVKEYNKRNTEEKVEGEKTYRQQIIDEYKKEHESNLNAPPDPAKGNQKPKPLDSEKPTGTARVSRKGDGAASVSE